MLFVVVDVCVSQQRSESEKGEFKRQLVAAHERSLELEGEVRSLKAAVEDAQTNAEQLEEMSRCGEEKVESHARTMVLLFGVVVLRSALVRSGIYPLRV